MHRLALLFFLLPVLVLAQTKAQRAAYDSLVIHANQAFQNREYTSAGQFYLDAIAAFGDRGFAEDRYKAAQALAQAGRPEPAFANLQRLLDKTGHLEYGALASDSLLAPLHADPRWNTLLEALRPEMPELALRLQEVSRLDQDLRKQIDPVRAKYGPASPELKAHWEQINTQDSINLLEIRQLLDTYGWLGPKQVGSRGNTAIWLVIQHADLATQEHYLPMMQAAADVGKATCGNLAYLEDRILMRKKRKQLYGSQQIIPNGAATSFYHPVEDPDNLNVRREGMGLPPFAPEVIEEIRQTSK